MNVSIDLSEAQANFFEAETRGRMYLGSLGSGKTKIMCYCALMDALNAKHTCIVSFSYRNLKDVVIPTMLEIIRELDLESFCNYKMVDNVITCGGPILFRTADTPDRLRGLNLHSFYLEEARELTRDTFDIMIGRLRRKGRKCHWGIVSTTRGKNWMYDIIKEEGLLGIFNNDCRYLKNDNITLVRTEIDDVPFLPEEYVEELKRQYTSTFAKQELKGLIIDTEGEIFNTEWFIEKSVTGIGGVRFWDLAVTTKTTSDNSASCRMTLDKGLYKILHMSKHKLSWPQLKRKIINFAISDGDNVTICIEEAGQQRAIIDDLRSSPELTNYTIRSYRPTKDKVTRAYPVASQAELGNVILNDGAWKRHLYDELSTFSVDGIKNGTLKNDMVDAMTGAYYMVGKATRPRVFSIPM